MEHVNEFTKELNSLLESRPPVSKAKMTAITKAATKAVRMYKHVVLAVEKFIHKCQAHYKIPGLYVIDSIVRQSRHQFGPEKDVYGPRFSRNFPSTFQNLFTTCNPDDRPKIVRVLNLWMKNNTFDIAVIEPLLDLANPNLSSQSGSSSGLEITTSNKGHTPDQSSSKRHRHHQHSNANEAGGNNHMSSHISNNLLNANSDEGSDHNRNMMQQIQQQIASVLNSGNANMPGFSSQQSNQSSSSTNIKDTIKKVFSTQSPYEDEDDAKGDTPTESEPQTSSMGKSNLDFSPTPIALSMAQNLLSNPDLLKKLQMIGDPNAKGDMFRQSGANNEYIDQQMQVAGGANAQAPFSYPSSLNERLQQDAYSLPFQQGSFASSAYRAQTDKNSFMTDSMNRAQNSSFTSPNSSSAAESCSQPLYVNNQGNDDTHRFDAHASMHSLLSASGMLQNQFSSAQTSTVSADLSGVAGDSRQFGYQSNERQRSQGYDDNDARDRDHRGRRGSPSRDHGRDRFSQRSNRRSRSRSPNRGSRWGDRSSGRSPKSRYDRRRSQSPGEKEREKERERRRKGLPPIRPGYLTICSTTLWLGHVPKLTSEADLSDHFGEYGTVTSIDLIPPRGCAYVCMDRRQDAYRALQELKNIKLHGSTIKMAWAPGKGMKGKEYKDYWEVDSGASYIPYEKLSDDVDLEALEEGGMIDEETVPAHLQEIRRLKAMEKAEKAKQESVANPIVPVPPVGANPYAVPGLMVPTVSVPPPIIGSSAPLVYPDPSIVTATSSMDATLISYPHLKPNNPPNELIPTVESKDIPASVNSSSATVPSSNDVPRVANLFQHPPPPIGVPPPPPSLLAGQNQPWLRVPPPGPPSLLPGPPPPLASMAPGVPPVPPVPGAPPVSIPPAPNVRSPSFESPIKGGANNNYSQRSSFNEGSFRESPLKDDPFAPSLYELRAMERGNIMRPQQQGLLPPPGPPLRNFREEQPRAFDSRGPGNREWRNSNQGGSNFDRRGRDDRNRNRGQDWNRRDRNNGGGRGDRDNRDRSYNRSGFDNRRDSDPSNKRDRSSRWESSDKDKNKEQDRRGSSRDKKSDNQDNGQTDSGDTNSGFYIPPVEPEEKIGSQDKITTETESDSSAPPPPKQEEEMPSVVDSEPPPPANTNSETESNDAIRSPKPQPQPDEPVEPKQQESEPQQPPPPPPPAVEEAEAQESSELSAVN